MRIADATRNTADRVATNPESLVISVHFPKAGGKSTEALLREHYGDQLLLDNDDDPHTPVSRRHIDPTGFMSSGSVVPSGIRAIHGHFHPGKYRHRTDARFFTVLRHPVPWLISLHWYWRSCAEGLVLGHPVIWGPVHDYAVRERLTPEQLARLPIVNTMFSETYFGGWDMRRFSHIGRLEDRPAAIAALSGLVGAELSPERRENVNQPRPEIGECLQDTVLLNRLERILSTEVRFYERWTSR